MYPEPLYWCILGHCRNVSWANVRMYPEPLYRCILSHCTNVSWANVRMNPESMYGWILSQCTDVSWAIVRMYPEPLHCCIMSFIHTSDWSLKNIHISSDPLWLYGFLLVYESYNYPYASSHWQWLSAPDHQHVYVWPWIAYIEMPMITTWTNIT